MDDYGYPIPAQKLQQINERLDDGSERMGGIEHELSATRQELHQLQLQLADLLEFFGTMKAAIKVFNWVGKLAKPAASIVGLCASVMAVYAAWRGVR